MYVHGAPNSEMPRRTIYIHDELDLAIRNHRGEINLSNVCAEALRAELSARESIGTLEGLLSRIFTNEAPLERRVRHRFKLRRVIAGQGKDLSPRETVSIWTSIFLNESLFEGLRVAMGGGTQMWDVARRLEPRNLGLNVWALGFGHVDHETPHVHPNALVTLLAMMYGSRTRPRLVGVPGFPQAWSWQAGYPEHGKGVRRLIMGSCSPFDADSPFAKVLGEEMTDYLAEENVIGDFLGVFIAPGGKALEPFTPSLPISHITRTELQQFARRDDTIVLLAAAGGHKVKLIRQVLALGLCNTMITDEATADALLTR
jgi:DNA-binding transcriptional regulator LsrR (DeoR family)